MRNARDRPERLFLVYGLGWGIRFSCIGHDVSLFPPFVFFAPFSLYPEERQVCPIYLVLLHAWGAPRVSAVIAALVSYGVSVRRTRKRRPSSGTYCARLDHNNN